jgi:hypothetical protein
MGVSDTSGECGAKRQADEVHPAGTASWERHRCCDPKRIRPVLVHQTEITRQLHPHLPPTPLWAYDDGSGLAGQSGSFGMAVVAQSGTPLEVSFTHDLPDTHPDWIPVDTGSRRSVMRCD